MAWIKRNLFFVIGSLVAVALMGLAGWYLYGQWQHNNEIWDKLSEQCGILDKLNKERPHPGGGSVDNIKTAREQQGQLTNYQAGARVYFRRIPPIPAARRQGGRVTSREFNDALQQTIDQMQHQAANATVILTQPDFGFSFAAERHSLKLTEGAPLEGLAAQLGEVKTICDVLFEAKISSLDMLRREAVSPDDSGPAAQQTDYLAEHSVTNGIAVLRPYELTFHCFSSELAAVLAGFARSTNALIVKSINVEATPPSDGAPGVLPPPGPGGPGGLVPPQPPVSNREPYPTPGGVTPAPGVGIGRAPGAGIAPAPGVGIGRAPGAGIAPAAGVGIAPAAGVGIAPAAGVGIAPALTGGGAPAPTPVAYYSPRPVAGRGGLKTVLDERQLKITLMLDVVRLAGR